MRFGSIISGILPFLGVVCGYANPGACSGTCTNTHDSMFGVQDSAIGVATSSSMDVGTWTDRGATGIRSSSGKTDNAIDPNLINVNGAYLLNFGSF
ncbi:hypothetical protein F5Y04DRAFT_257604 [Hypomontagnella monticulosa]|nr:hypothetical protein F5Y04DRAFT_257604 [Hypomontagnella monticulosa]